MKKSTIVIGLDAAEPRLLKEWMADDKNPVLHNDNGLWWHPEYVIWIQQALKESIDEHSAIAHDLLQQDNWGLFLMVFREIVDLASSILNLLNGRNLEYLDSKKLLENIFDLVYYAPKNSLCCGKI